MMTVDTNILVRYAVKVVTKIISITLDDEILQAGDTLSKILGMTLSAFTEHALRLAIQQQRIEELEAQHRQGYLKHPVGEDEFIRVIER